MPEPLVHQETSQVGPHSAGLAGLPLVHEVLGDKHTKCLTPQHCKCLCNVCKEAR
jgi:hypothetical protein